MFLHLDLMHLAFNMVALYSVGALLEQVLGKANFVLLYFIGGITGNAVSYLAGMADGVLRFRPAHQRACSACSWRRRFWACCIAKVANSSPNTARACGA